MLLRDFGLLFMLDPQHHEVADDLRGVLMLGRYWDLQQRKDPNKRVYLVCCAMPLKIESEAHGQICRREPLMTKGFGLLACGLWIGFWVYIILGFGSWLF